MRDESQPQVITDGIYGHGPYTHIMAGRWTIIPQETECFITLEVGNFTSIAKRLKIISGQHPCIEHPEVFATFPFREHWPEVDYPASKHNGRVVIGSDVWIGEDVHILEGVTIGHGAIIGACAVVARDVPPYAITVGNPAGIKKYRFSRHTIGVLLEAAWWDWDDERIKSSMGWLSGQQAWRHE